MGRRLQRHLADLHGDDWPGQPERDRHLQRQLEHEETRMMPRLIARTLVAAATTLGMAFTLPAGAQTPPDGRIAFGAGSDRAKACETKTSIP
jgi:hypothetical protein